MDIIAVILIVILLALIAKGVFETVGATKKVLREEKEMHTLLESAVKHTETIYYNVSSRRLYNAYGSTIPPEGLSVAEAEKRMDSGEIDRVRGVISELVTGRKESDRVSFRWNEGGEDNPLWHNYRAFVRSERDSRGRVENVFYVLYDVTAEVVKSRRMKRLTWLFRQVFEQSMAGKAFFDAEGKCLGYNKKMQELFEPIIDFDTFPSTSYYDLEPIRGLRSPSNLDPLYVCTRFEGKRDRQTVERVFKYYYEIRSFTVLDESGKLLFIELSVLDDTEARDIYLEVRAKGKAIEESSRKAMRFASQFGSLLKFGELVLWRIDWRKNMYMLSKDFVSEYEGFPIDRFGDLLDDDSRGRYAADLGKLEHGTPEPFSEIFHIIHPGRPGLKNWHERWLMISAVPVDRPGERTTYFGLQRDITKMVLLEKELKEATEQAENLAQIKSLFLANMSHEIRTPLNAIVGFSQLLDNVEGDERQHLTAIIKQNSEMLLRLINDILEISAIDRNKLPSQPKPTFFSRDFGEACRSVCQNIAKDGVELIIDNPLAALHLNIDMERMTQVINNFAINAAKNTSKGHIRLGYRYRNGMLTIYCEDTGCGIPKDKQKAIFERFVKLDSFVQGTGLGLSICKAIANGCGGETGVDSEPGKGSTFWIKIPAREIS